ncbi:glycoside hydrolase family 1 protein [Ligilactobacillus sp. WILCCON 0076]|uniref:Glycoside hydrolase family 1 protein n=1 Tax=Ligilactobacillus ubinensis TaxID=2876789 RepID=A0A9X2FMV8_9LACO|nr:glycoside hydrolase family 1 protein [Ligilactobacillus ubinensis]MCP0888065.1 glycoside hydrolase family 1 protein [Ligilactobacillus ubinensis]
MAIGQNFMWGGASSAFQVEGARDEDGRGLSLMDLRASSRNHKQMDTEVSVDQYHHLQEDIGLMKELGVQSYRFSISWSRVFPTGHTDKPNKKGIQYYHDLIDGLKKVGIKPVVTMFHFDFPKALYDEYAGWNSRRAIDDFVAYGKFLIDEYGKDVAHWLTVNEQGVIVLDSELLGIDPKQDKQVKFQKAYQANLYLWIAQAKLYKYCHEKYPESLIGPAISYITTIPYDGTSEDVAAAKELEDFYSFAQMEVAIKGTIPQYFTRQLLNIGINIEVTKEDSEVLKQGTANFLGLNWYCTTIVKHKPNYFEDEFIFNRIERKQKPTLRYTDWGWNDDPTGLYYGLRQVMDRYPDIPLMITECGWSEKEKLVDGKVHDDDRIRYLKGHVEALQNARKDGVNVFSFNVWSMFDLLSVGDGMEKRYGLIYVDRTDFDEKTLKRYPKDSYYWYQNFIREYQNKSTNNH